MLSRERLTNMLREAADKHHSTFGNTEDPDWPAWYANAMIDELQSINDDAYSKGWRDGYNESYAEVYTILKSNKKGNNMNPYIIIWQSKLDGALFAEIKLATSSNQALQNASDPLDDFKILGVTGRSVSTERNDVALIKELDRP